MSKSKSRQEWEEEAYEHISKFAITNLVKTGKMVQFFEYISKQAKRNFEKITLERKLKAEEERMTVMK